MAPGHAWSGKPHYSLYLLPLQWLVAMNRAPGTGWFSRAVRAFLQALFSVSKKVITAFAKLAIIRLMMV
jgi:hypothetical protein